ncbi:hypothetical protein SOVF_039270 [Spinacia oleracea]|uniref:Uncharacterized protein LOC110779381 n=1 Tax=Spinacia oleracea TaxID=3562 RepID=A0A9R0HZ38_SPIOL|nr:uncharacterized protein LOC110779381 [Spinacia oleracea]XP_056693817.1 uncharacterized protein LOC110779381 [Spinacia oleracea]XP_056693818.1 uncharacterized protein LOC110779381 [Spinacia oleracea]KNA21872.1 hypothetical protein SOVF_039270 [Spinacia oleracea]
MTLHLLRRTLISSSSFKHEPSNLTKLSNFPLFSTVVTQIRKPTSEITNYLIKNHNFSQETASKTATFLTRLKDFKKSGLVLEFFEKNGFSKTQLEELVIRDPGVLASDLNKSIRVKFEGIKDLGFSNDELANLLCAAPAILTLPRSGGAIVSSISALQNIVGSNSDVTKLLKVCNWFLNGDLNSNLLPNIELMKKCGISQLQIRQNLFSFPRLFLQKHEIIRDCVRRVDEMGLRRDSKMYIHGLRVLKSMTLEKWESKLKLFKNLGFSEGDILSVFRRTPQVFAVSEKKILEVSKLLLSYENVDVAFLVQHPELFIFSAGSRIRPRMEIIGVLLSKSLLLKEPSLTTLCKLDDEAFILRYVIPYVGEVGEVGEKYLVSTGFKSL